MVVTKYRGQTSFTVRGPETRATPAFCPPDGEFLGIVFKAGAFMPLFPANILMDRQDLNLPLASSKSFWLNGSAWQFPSFENADTFIDRLTRSALLVYDPLIDTALREQPHHLSNRTMQRRFLQATGLSYNMVYQIQRARYATTLLEQGRSILDVVEIAGYSDQPHMTRALRNLMGQTPAQIVSKNLVAPMSFLFKTLPF
jgi:AraC-like DNA-binding protein